MPSIANTEKIVFDFSDVRALQDDETDLWNRNLTKAKIAKELVMAGYDPLESLQLAGLEQINYVGMPKTNQPPTLLELETPKLKSLPEIKQVPSPDKEKLTALAKRITKSQKELGDKFVEEIEPEINKYFIRLLNRADSIIGRSLSKDDTEQKSPTPPFNADNLIPSSADIEIQTIMRPIHMRVIESTFSLLNAELGVANAIPFDQTLPSVQQFLVQGSTRIKEINNTTRKKIKKVIAEGVNRGYTYDQIARGVSGENYNGVRSVVKETYKNRARAIARAEVSFSQNSASYVRYESAGIEKVYITDAQRGVDHDAICLEVNDTVQPITWFSTNMIQHPNCSRISAPVVET